jgi:hypothetical protein
MNRALLFAPALLALSLSPALAQSKCFSIREFEGWRAPDAKTINIRVGQTRYYRLDLGNACPMLTEPGAHLITKTTGTDQVCSGVDWDLAVAHDTMGSLASHCIVKAMTPLTQAEADALPKKYKP